MQQDGMNDITSPCTPITDSVKMCEICAKIASYECYPRITGFPVRTLKTKVPMCVEHAREVDKRIGEVRL